MKKVGDKIIVPQIEAIVLDTINEANGKLEPLSNYLCYGNGMIFVMRQEGKQCKLIRIICNCCIPELDVEEMYKTCIIWKRLRLYYVVYSSCYLCCLVCL